MSLSHVVGFDDAPFSREHRGAVFASTRLEGILSGKVRRDGRNATPVISHLVRRSRFSMSEAEGLIKRLAAHSQVPEPLRVAHLIPGGIVVGESRHSV